MNNYGIQRKNILSHPFLTLVCFFFIVLVPKVMTMLLPSTRSSIQRPGVLIIFTELQMLFFEINYDFLSFADENPSMTSTTFKTLNNIYFFKNIIKYIYSYEVEKIMSTLIFYQENNCFLSLYFLFYVSLNISFFAVATSSNN